MSKELGLVLNGWGYDYAKTVLSYYLREKRGKRRPKSIEISTKMISSGCI